MSRRPRILIWQWGRRGGGPRYTYELAKALIAQGKYEVFLSLSRQSEIFDLFQALHAPGWHVDTYAGLPQAIFSSCRLPAIRKGFWRYVSEQNIDLVICTMSHLWNVPVLIARRPRLPFLLVLHDALPHPGDDVPLRRWLLGQEIRQAGGIVTLTAHVQQELCREYGYPPARSRVIPHGVFSYGAMTRPIASPARLLFFGRILPYKGLDLLLKAYALLRKNRQDVELLIAGPGDLHPYRALLDRLDGITIDNRWISEDAIGAVFQNADICVLPYREASQSGVIPTAYAAHMPVVATPVGGLAEQVRHEVTGLICESAAPEAIAAAIGRLLDDRALLRRCGEGAGEAAKSLAWPAIAVQFGAMIESMLAERRS